MKSVLTLTCLIGLLGFVRVSAEPLIEGRVRLDSGEPVANAQVRLFDMTDLQRAAIAHALTDGTGYFALPLAVLGGRALPERFALGPNYPNPFNPSTIIPYQLAASSRVRLEVFNLLGQRLATLVDGERPAGFHTATWYAMDAAGRAAGAGVYIYRMTVGAASQTGRMVLIDGQAGVSPAGAASVWSGASGGGSAGEQVYGLIVSGEGLVPYVDSAFRVEAGMAPVELVVSVGSGKAADDDCALCNLLDALNDDDEGPSPSGKAQVSLAAPPEPTNLRVEAVTDSSGRVRWDAAEGATDYDVNYKRAVGGKWTNEPHEGVRLYTTIYDLEPNTEYRWAARAENSDGYSEWVFGPNFTTLPEEDETPEDDHGNTRSGATSLSLGSSFAGQIEPGGDVDYFSVQVGESGTLTVYTTGSLDTKGTLESSSGSRLASNDDGGSDTNFRIERAVSAGTYYIKVESYRSSTGSYTIHASVSGDETPEEEEEATEEAEEDTPEDVPDDAQVNIPDAKLRAAIAKELGKARGQTITVADMKTLTSLEEENAGISDLTGLEFATNLTWLWLWGNDLSDVSPLRGLTNLYWLGLGGNNLSDVSPLRGLTNLTGLGLDFNNLSDVSPLRGLTNLYWLGLGGNNLSDVSPLRGLTKLTDLYLDFNNLSDVSPLRGLTNLTRLDLGNNDLLDISPLRGLTKLEDLELRGTPLNSSSINDHIPALTRSGATVLFDQFREGSDFDIELVFLDDAFSERHKRVIQYAARRWMSIIREDLPDYTFTRGWSGTCGDQSYRIPSGERIDDLRIHVVSFSDDAFIAGWGGADVLRETSHLSVVGCMGFNLDDNFVFLSTALHEVGHVLGIGTQPWWNNGFVQESPGDVHFNGPRAIAAFNAAGGRNYTGKKVPLEEDWAHWRQSVLAGELMDPSGGTLSAITIQSLADIGYSVDVSQADPYTLPSAAAKVVAAGSTPDDRLPGRLAPERTCGAGQQREPIYVIDPQGRIVRTLHR